MTRSAITPSRSTRRIIAVEHARHDPFASPRSASVPAPRGVRMLSPILDLAPAIARSSIRTGTLSRGARRDLRFSLSHPGLIASRWLLYRAWQRREHIERARQCGSRPRFLSPSDADALDALPAANVPSRFSLGVEEAYIRRAGWSLALPLTASRCARARRTAADRLRERSTTAPSCQFAQFNPSPPIVWPSRCDGTAGTRDSHP